MSNNVVQFPPERRVRVAPRHATDEQIARARIVERRLYELTEATMEGRLPARFCEAAGRPGDTEEPEPPRAA